LQLPLAGSSSSQQSGKGKFEFSRAEGSLLCTSLHRCRETPRRS